MNNKIYAGIAILSLSFFLFSCTKTTNTVTIKEIPSRATPTGSITGMVYSTRDIYNLSLPLKGVTVSIDNTSISASTDSAGIYTLRSVPAGTYTLTFHKDSFGDVKGFNYYFPGNGQAYTGKAILNLRPLFSFYNLKDSLTSVTSPSGFISHYWDIYFKIANVDSLNNMGAMIFFGLKPDFSANDLVKIYYTNYYIPKGIDTVGYEFEISSLINNVGNYISNPHGATIYFKIYPETYYHYSYDYSDPIKGGQYTSLGSPISGQFILP